MYNIWDEIDNNKRLKVKLTAKSSKFKDEMNILPWWS